MSISLATPLTPLPHLHLLPLRRPITFLSHFSLLRSSSLIAISLKSSAKSWSTADDSTPPNFNGWSLPGTPSSDNNTGFPTLLVVAIGTSFALLAAVAHFSLTNRGFRWPFQSLSPGSSKTVAIEADTTNTTDSVTPIDENPVSDAALVEPSDVVVEPVTSERHQPRIVTVVVDPTQQEAVNLLKKLKIMDEEIKAEELCTRREYARWLLRGSSLLERNPKYKLSTAVALAGSTNSAFRDVTTGDEDFDIIQALAEAGILPSKLSSDHRYGENFNFYPESFISRRDLIDWRGQLEYDFVITGNQEMLNQKLNLLDVREIVSDEWPGLLMDMLAGDKSLLRRVFGKIRRLQPNKPSTVAQAAVALTSGRMTEAIQNELLRLEAEESSRQVAKEEILRELLDRGEIKRYWDEKMEWEKARGLEVQQLYMEAVNNLEQEKIVQKNAFNGFLKVKAAMDCQKQLLNSLKEEVSEMSERLLSERAEQIAEEETAQTLRCDLQAKKEGVLDAKSVLEAEIEALRILRSWIEDEARKSNARSKVLEEVGRRWKIDSL